MNHKSEPLDQATPLQRAVLALKEVRAQFDAYKDAQQEPLAVVGMGCRFPGGVDSPEAYWQLLRNGVDAITPVPRERWDAEKLYDADPDAPGKISLRHGGFLSNLEQFDPQFFGVSPREALSMDPQQRLFLEVAWEALEHANCAPDRLLGHKTGVFAGVTMSDYLHLARQQSPEKIDAYFLTGNCLNVVPGRVSFFLGVHGPSLAVDTACSSSLTAIHLACQSLRRDECEIALAGGVNVMLMPEILISASRAHMFAGDGRCKTFDARADGFVRGEGCGVVVLKRLSAAQKNGDRIFAIIRGSAMNQDGPSSGLTVPNSEAQKELIRAALRDARVAPHQMQYVEAHGTGTSLGDPIEVRSLGEVLSAGRTPEQPLVIGSVKTNLGHLESAAGVAGLIKVALALHHGEIPPHLHFQKLNPDISLDAIHARIPTQIMPWPAWSETRLAGVSAFGMSGTNVHVILQGAAVASDRAHDSSLNTDHCSLATDHRSLITDTRTAHLLTLSAKEENALKQMATNYERHLATHEEQTLAEVCYSANIGRAKFSQRLAIVANSSTQAHARLNDFIAGREAAGVIPGAASGKKLKLAFLYAGQGYQYLNMGRVLYQTQPTFRRALEQCDELFRPYLKTSLLDVLYPETGNEQRGSRIEDRESKMENRASNFDPQSSILDPRSANLLDQTFFTQPAMFSLQYALTQLWLSWGVTPAVVMGHSLGEFMAAQLAGVYSLEDAVKLVAERGRLTEDVPAVGMMASVQARAETVTQALADYHGNICLAAINGPDSVVITGIKADVNDLLARFEREGVNVRRLAISNAFHSPFIEPALNNFSRVAAEVRYHQPKLPLVSTLTGQLLRFDLQSHEQRSTNHDPQSSLNNPQTYWRNHLREPVQFFAAMRTLHEMGVDSFLEIGPNPTQLGMGRRCLPEGYGYWFPSLRQGRDDWQQMLESAGAMFVAGGEIDWRGFDQDYARRFVSLPTYPFQRKRFWIDDRGSRIEDRKARSSIFYPQSSILHPLLQHCTRSPLIKETILTAQVSAARFAYLADHKIHGMLVLPLTCHLEIILAGAREAFGESVARVADIVMHEPLLLPEEEAVNLQLVLQPEEHGAATLQLISVNEKDAAQKSAHKTHVSGKVVLSSAGAQPIRLDLPTLHSRCAQEVAAENFYGQLWHRGLHFGPQFRGVQTLRRRENEALGQIALPQEAHEEHDEYYTHPALLDACLQVFATAWPQATTGNENTTFLPLSVESFCFYKRPRAHAWSHVVLRPSEKTNAETRTGDVAVYDDQGALAVELKGFVVKRTSAEALQNVLQENLEDWFYEIAWREKALAALPAPAQLTGAAQALLPELRAEERFAAYEEMLPHLDQLCAAYVSHALRQLGLQFELHEQFTLASLAQKLGVIEKHHRLLARLLEILEQEGVLQHENEAWRVCRVPEKSDPAAQAEALRQKYPASIAELQLTQRCGEQLARVLHGEQEPLQLLFPNGSMELLEPLYQRSPLTQAMNRLAARAINEALANFPRKRKLRVLEIGAGTGGTTAYVLPQITHANAEYVFTDVSPAFLHKAKEKFQAHSFVRYQTFDLERDPLAQNFEAHGFDLILAVNVLHATADLRQSLQHVAQLLAPEGLLLVIEGAARERWVDLTFGLTEGWWKFTDAELREDYPLLAQTQWLQLLESLRFREGRALPAQSESEESGRVFAQHAMLIARAPEALPESASRRWLIFADENGFGKKLSARLEARGQSCVLVHESKAFSCLHEKHFELDPQRAEDFQRLLREAEVESNCAGVIYLWPQNQRVHDAIALEELTATQSREGAGLLYLTQALLKANNIEPPRLWLVTRGAQSLGVEPEAVDPAQAALWGLAKIIGLEHPELRCTRVDLPANDEEASAQNLFAEIIAQDREDMVAYRAGKCYVARLVRCALKSEDGRSRIEDRGLKIETHDPQSSILYPQSTTARQLQITSPGVLDSLQYQSATRRPPQAGEIEIRVHAVGLNFRDVLNALGMYPGDAGPLGADCSGVIVAVGEGVREFRVGDEVLGLAPGCFGTFVTTAAELAVHKPASFRFTEASTIPSAFLTAYDTLIVLAQLQAGERVLIHNAVGGVGLAAVQLAKRTGAEIFATAGNEEKRALLRKLGVAHVFDSRSLEFEQEILSRTNNVGVDVVLNSLTGDFIRASLAVLKEHGRFLEIGKRGIWSREQVDAFKKVSAYHIIDLAAEAHGNPAAIKAMLQEIMRGFADGSLQPLPVQLYPASETLSAFRCMQGAKHVGKVVVEFVGENSSSKIEDSGSFLPSHDPRSSIFNPQSTILITGGLAGLGLLTAQWLVEKGARHLALMARSVPSEPTRAAIAEMEQCGAKILVMQGDVSREEDVRRALHEIKQNLPALRGVIHAAGVLDDGALLQQNWSRFQTVLAPKVRGAWLLHQLTQDEPLDWFVLYSSMTSMLGTAGQANHAMANAFLDGLAHYRRARGQAGVSIHWGAWSEIGAAAERNVEARTSVQGLGSIAPKKGLLALQRILRQNPIEVGVAPINWTRYAQQFAGARAPFFAELIASAPVEVASKPVVSSKKTPPKILEQLHSAPAHLRKNILLGYVKDQALRVLGLESSQPLDKEQPLQKMGLDSLMAVELRNVLGKGLDLKRALPATLLFDYPTVTAVADYLAQDVLAFEATGATHNGKAQNVVVETEKKDLEKKELAQLSEEEAETLLLEELGGE